MIRFLLRFIGLWMLAAAFIFLVYDGAGWVANGVLNSMQVGTLWASIHQNSLLMLQPAVERHVAGWLWNPVIMTVLEQPVWLVFGSHWCRADPAWPQEKAAHRLRAGVSGSRAEVQAVTILPIY